MHWTANKGLPGVVKPCCTSSHPIEIHVVIYNSAYPLLFDFNPRFWHTLCTYALSTEVNDEGNSKTEIGTKNDVVNFALTYKLIQEYLGEETQFMKPISMHVFLGYLFSCAIYCGLFHSVIDIFNSILEYTVWPLLSGHLLSGHPSLSGHFAKSWFICQ